MNNGVEHPGVLDAMAHDRDRDKVVLAMYERRPWDGGDQQLFQLQEKLNAYLSFILDGEMLQAFPQLADKDVEIQLRTLHLPNHRAADLMRRMREQLAFQQIVFEVIQVDDEAESCGEGGCGCSCDH